MFNLYNIQIVTGSRGAREQPSERVGTIDYIVPPRVHIEVRLTIELAGLSLRY